MSDLRWVRVTSCENVPLREGRAVTIDGRELAIFNLGPSTALATGDRFVATDNRCPHRGGPLCDGIVTGASVVCPLHAWKVNLHDGCVERPGDASAQAVATYPVRIEEGVLVVGVPPVGSVEGPGELVGARSFKIV